MTTLGSTLALVNGLLQLIHLMGALHASFVGFRCPEVYVAGGEYPAEEQLLKIIVQ